MRIGDEHRDDQPGSPPEVRPHHDKPPDASEKRSFLLTRQSRNQNSIAWIKDMSSRPEGGVSRGLFAPSHKP
uniref:Uncharacterized protein n=1 Tax=Candidatus Kentrum sp. LFY TaxID=2126342 RepID=A0A450V9M3_9GAMM|nr:MAG: hypothetical protein BECKLFY1418A_GA0070994_11455 [Candidatus Kentron sp. LFY]